MTVDVGIFDGVHVADDVEMALHCMKEVVEVVGNTTGKSADGFESLPMECLFLPLLPFAFQSCAFCDILTVDDEHGDITNHNRGERESGISAGIIDHDVTTERFCLFIDLFGP